MANVNLSKAKNAKNDEFYTQYSDIENEVLKYVEYNPDVFRGKTILLPCDDPEWSNFTKFFAERFEEFGLKRLISTGYAPDAKKLESWLPSAFEQDDQKFDIDKSRTHGRIFTLDHDITHDGHVDFADLEWEYLAGKGDFRSVELKKLRDEADVIITNPPFSLFREFVAWITEAKKQFLIIGNMNAITYREIFPLIKANKMWLGDGFAHGNAYFGVPQSARTDYANGVFDVSTNLVKFRNVCWFTNIDHGRRHQPLNLMTMNDNMQFSKHKDLKENGYRKYDNYDAIEVPYTDAIPSDYEGVMGVPISFLDKYCPEQFEIIGCSYSYGDPGEPCHKPGDSYAVTINGENIYKRIFIRKIK